MHNPWKTLSSKTIYQNRWIRLREDKIIDPSGSSGIYGVVETHPAIGIVPVTADLKTYLVGQYRYTLDKYSWEIPEGGAEPGETPLQCAQRELKEETGLSANQWTDLDTLYTSNSITNEIGYLFLARDLVQAEANPESTELLEIKKLPFSEAVEMVHTYEIKDALSIIGIMRTLKYLKDHSIL